MCRCHFLSRGTRGDVGPPLVSAARAVPVGFKSPALSFPGRAGVLGWGGVCGHVQSTVLSTFVDISKNKEVFEVGCMFSSKRGGWHVGVISSAVAPAAMSDPRW